MTSAKMNGARLLMGAIVLASAVFPLLGSRSVKASPAEQTPLIAVAAPCVASNVAIALCVGGSAFVVWWTWYGGQDTTVSGIQHAYDYFTGFFENNPTNPGVQDIANQFALHPAYVNLTPDVVAAFQTYGTATSYGLTSVGSTEEPLSGCPSACVYEAVAQQVTLPASNIVELAVYAKSAGNTVYLSLYADVGNHPTGSALALCQIGITTTGDWRRCSIAKTVTAGTYWVAWQGLVSQTFYDRYNPGSGLPYTYHSGARSVGWGALPAGTTATNRVYSAVASTTGAIPYVDGYTAFVPANLDNAVGAIPASAVPLADGTTAIPLTGPTTTTGVTDTPGFWEGLFGGVTDKVTSIYNALVNLPGAVVSAIGVAFVPSNGPFSRMQALITTANTKAPFGWPSTIFSAFTGLFSGSGSACPQIAIANPYFGNHTFTFCPPTGTTAVTQTLSVVASAAAVLLWGWAFLQRFLGGG